jgi:hypothetical protein
VRITGDHYQWLLAWQGCVLALRDHALQAGNPIIALGVEADNAGNLDDIIFWRERPPHRYHQAKYAVDSSTPVNTDYLTKRSPSGGPSILRKIATAYRDLTRDGASVELVLVTNRAPDADDRLLAGRDARTKLLMPAAGEQTSRSSRGKTRTQWARDAGLTEDQLLRMLSALRFDTAKDLPDIEMTASLLMQVAGLRSDPKAVNAGADWVAAQVRDGQKRLELDVIQKMVEDLDLQQGPSRAVLSIATLKPDPLADQAAHRLDWVDRFDGPDAYTKRRPMPPATWAQLQQDIDDLPSRLRHVSQVAMTGSLRQATAFAVGAALRMVTNVDLAVTQRTQLWVSNATYDSPIQPTVVEHQIGQGNDIALAVEVATELTEDVMTYLRDRQLPIDRLIVLQPAGGPKDNAIPDGATANALAIGLRNQARRSSRGCNRVHLFLAGPMGLALLLGHRWNRVAPTTVYEEVLAVDQYEPAFRVSA